jgi:hypothetical protein
MKCAIPVHAFLTVALMAGCATVDKSWMSKTLAQPGSLGTDLNLPAVTDPPASLGMAPPSSEPERTK